MSNPCIEFVTPKVELITPSSWLPIMAQIVEIAGRKSHKSEPKGTDASAFIKRVALKLKHESILEHAHITLNMRMSRAASHQLVRHRHFSFVQESQRYCDYGKRNGVLKILAPWRALDGFQVSNIEGLKFTPTQTNCVSLVEIEESPQWADIQCFSAQCLQAYETYLVLRRNCKPEDARVVLPNATATEIIATSNVRNWRYFFRLRCDRHAQEEIRTLAKMALSMLIDNAPWGFSDDEMQTLLGD